MILPIKYKLIDKKARKPEQGHAGISLYVTKEKISSGSFDTDITYDTGVEFQIPEGHVGLVYLAKDAATSTLVLTPSPTIITPDDRGTVKLRFQDTSTFGVKYNVGDKIAELLVVEKIGLVLEEVVDEEEGQESDRTLQGQDPTVGIGEQTIETTAKEG